MGRLFVQQVEKSCKYYQCRYCGMELTTVDELVSKSFHSRAGVAYLFDNVYNVTYGKSEERLMTTGMHMVADINCVQCWASCGWKYLHAHEKAQKYKEGKYILERAKLVDYVVPGQLSQRSSSTLDDTSEWGQDDCDSDDPCT